MVDVITSTPAPFSTEMGLTAPAEGRRAVDILAAIEMN